MARIYAVVPTSLYNKSDKEQSMHFFTDSHTITNMYFEKNRTPNQAPDHAITPAKEN
jgi:hypothetical protein